MLMAIVPICEGIISKKTLNLFIIINGHINIFPVLDVIKNLNAE